ncbi:MAG: transcriptional regulator FtrA [Acidobacteriota bacterium]
MAATHPARHPTQDPTQHPTQQTVHSRVVALAYNDFYAFDFAFVSELFGRLRPEFQQWYDFRICAIDPPPIRGTGGLSIEAAEGLDCLDEADTIIIPGWRQDEVAPPEELLDKLRAAYAGGARLLSICTGAFVLAATGLLDGRRATTHWLHADKLARRYPAVCLEPGVLYVDEGRLLTSAGSAAGIDLCLYVIRKDLGAQVANAVARRMVVPPHRDGGQSQFIDQPSMAEETCGLSPLLDWLRQNLGQEHTVESLAARACLTPRTFARRFQDMVGTSPHRWLTRERIFRAQELLETTTASIERVAEESGFGSAQVLRLHFRRHVGTTPVAYRKTFQGRTAAQAS